MDATLHGSPVRTLTARAPTRLDFGGGWTDVPPYCGEQGGFVCCAAIARYARVTLTEARKEDSDSVTTVRNGRDAAAIASAALARAGARGVAIALRSDFPVGAGLGGSSAAAVAAVGALAAWAGARLQPADLAEASRALENEDLSVAGGRQDHYAAAFGGVLGLRFSETTTVERVPLTGDVAKRLADHCTVVYTGESRASSQMVRAVLDAYRQRDPVVVAALARTRELAEAMIAALRRGAIDELGLLVGEQWAQQRRFHPAIATPRIDAIVDRARLGGALGAKALGASAGGCVLVMAPPDRSAALRLELASLGEILPVSLDFTGFVTETA